MKIRDDHWLSRLFSIDYRSLAILRVGLALCIYGVLWSYISYDTVYAFLSDNGLYPREYVLRSRAPIYWSLYFLSGKSWFSIALLSLTGLSATALLIGYRTRLATILSWVLIVSLINRTPILLQGGDSQLCVLLFWSMFLPLGARWSVDSSLGPIPTHSKHYSMASAALLLQVMYLYLFSGLHKIAPEWFPEGSAVYYALNYLEVSSALGPYLAQFYGLTRWMTYYVYFLELLAPLFLLTPFFTRGARRIVVPQLIILHISFIIFLNVGLFPLISLTGLMAFVSSDFWEWAIHKTNTKKRTGIQIWYDQDCEFCNKVCRLFRELSLPRTTPIRPAQSTKHIGDILEKENSWVITDHQGNHHTHWDAVAYLWRRSPVLWPLGVLFLPKFMLSIGDVIYQSIANNRGRLGKLTSRYLRSRSQPTVFSLYQTTNIFLLLCMGCVLAWNLTYLPQVKNSQWRFSVSKSVVNFMRLTKLTQKWNMFAPRPSNLRRWHVIEGTLANGEKVDLYWNRRQTPVYEEPWSGYGANPNYRWRKFFSRASQKKWTKYGKLTSKRMGRYFCRRWKETHSKNDLLVTVEAHRYWYRTPKPGASKASKNHHRLLSYNCAN